MGIKGERKEEGTCGMRRRQSVQPLLDPSSVSSSGQRSKVLFSRPYIQGVYFCPPEGQKKVPSSTTSDRDRRLCLPSPFSRLR